MNRSPGRLFLFFSVIVFLIPFSLYAANWGRLTDVVRGRFPFVFYYPEGKEKLAGEVKAIIENSSPIVASELGLERSDTISVFISVTERGYLNIRSGRIPEWSAGFSDTRGRILGLNMAAILRGDRPMKEVVRHELSHLFLAQKVDYANVPVWFMEGLAMHQAGQWSLRRRMQFVEGVWKKEVPFLKDLDDGFPADAEKARVAYSLSFMAVERLLNSDRGDLVTLTSFTRDYGDFEKAFALTFGMTTEEYADQFHNYLSDHYGYLGTLLQSIPYFSGIALLMLIVYAVKRYKNYRKLKEWDRSENP
ncbi:MAG: hypothetical protein B6D63_03155 [Candidatus Latescibacteria bacterium 4484_7]|nr:MAG: hypothetical protein B6D63_03155 [Candidatus Latescibacteria bacterium 4484_7]